MIRKARSPYTSFTITAQKSPSPFKILIRNDQDHSKYAFATGGRHQVPIRNSRSPSGTHSQQAVAIRPFIRNIYLFHFFFIRPNSKTPPKIPGYLIRHPFAIGRHTHSPYWLAIAKNLKRNRHHTMSSEVLFDSWLFMFIWCFLC